MTNDSARELLREAFEWMPSEGLDDNLPDLRRLRARITALLSENANAKLMTDEQAAETDPYNCGVRP